MRKYVAIVFLKCVPVLHETRNMVITISQSSLKKLAQEFVMDLYSHKTPYDYTFFEGRISHFWVKVYSYGEYSEEKTSEFKGFVEREVETWNREVEEEISP